MAPPRNDRLPPELEKVGRLLREQRPEVGPLELDRLKRRIRSRAFARGGSPRLLVEKGTLVSSRVLVTILLGLGVFLSGTGAALAVAPQVLGGGDSAAAQYDGGDGDNRDGDGDGDDGDGDDGEDRGGSSDGVPPPTISVPPGGGDGGRSGPVSDQGRSGEDATGLGGDEADRAVQSARQEGASEDGKGGDRLPLTGLAAIPILLVGVAFLISGFIVRRRVV